MWTCLHVYVHAYICMARAHGGRVSVYMNICFLMSICFCICMSECMYISVYACFVLFSLLNECHQ